MVGRGARETAPVGARRRRGGEHAPPRQPDRLAKESAACSSVSTAPRRGATRRAREDGDRATVIARYHGAPACPTCVARPHRRTARQGARGAGARRRYAMPTCSPPKRDLAGRVC